MTAAPGADRPDPGESGLRYVDAMAELDRILAELEGDDLDVDELGTKVARAAQLIGWCRERIGAARMEVTSIVRDLDAG